MILGKSYMKGICLFLFGSFLWLACDQGNKTKGPVILEEEYYPEESNLPGVFTRLSEYKLFEGKLSDMKPGPNLVPYDLNASLFTDYAHKKRFIHLPEGTQMTYNEKEVLDFPEGAMIFKFFYYPHNFRDPEGAKTIMETRVLIKKNNAWIALPYSWDEAQTDATLALAGDTKPISWVDKNGLSHQIAYSIPNMNQCKSCHELDKKMVPIGPSARQLNKAFQYIHEEKNQLQHLVDINWLKDMPPIKDCPKLASWEDPAQASISVRARSYLEINCGHCHRPEGPAKNSALHLMAHVENPAAWGVGKTPIAAGLGSGGLQYDVVPGDPDASILVYRMESDDPGIMMPELGRKTAHKEGVQLVRDWIKEMK